ncbi:MAG: hypothetical protein ACOVQN_13325, partial [Exiguobacterium sp.]
MKRSTEKVQKSRSQKRTSFMHISQKRRTPS